MVDALREAELSVSGSMLDDGRRSLACSPCLALSCSRSPVAAVWSWEGEGSSASQPCARPVGFLYELGSSAPMGARPHGLSSASIGAHPYGLCSPIEGREELGDRMESSATCCIRELTADRRARPYVWPPEIAHAISTRQAKLGDHSCTAWVELSEGTSLAYGLSSAMRSLALSFMLEPQRARPPCMASYARPLARRWGARRHPHPRSAAAATPPCLGMKITGTSKEEAFCGVVLGLFGLCMSSTTL
ncbi:hypothetical protein Dimus_012662 [Dionaea muscipula]